MNIDLVVRIESVRQTTSFNKSEIIEQLIRMGLDRLEENDKAAAEFAERSGRKAKYQHLFNV